MSSEYSHNQVFSQDYDSLPKAFISPSKYIQGPGILKHLGKYLGILLNAKTVFVLTSARGKSRFPIEQSHQNIEYIFGEFKGECSYEESNRIIESISSKVDAIIGFGGGKLIDCAKFVSDQISVPCVIIPSLASNDAPCSALSIMYSKDHVFLHGVVFKKSPELVIVDSEIILNSPLRSFVAGMGDAIATFYEAKTCFSNPKGVSMLKCRPTKTAFALAELCANILFESGKFAIEAMICGKVSDDFEMVIEANTLLSGLGFESGGLAAAHGVASALTVIPSIEHNFMHGEMVAMGLITMLALENDMEQLEKVARFCAIVGLPNNFDQLALDLECQSDLEKIAEMTCQQWFTHNEPFEVTPSKVIQAMKTGHLIGKRIADELGNAAFERIHKAN